MENPRYTCQPVGHERALQQYGECGACGQTREVAPEPPVTEPPFVDPTEQVDTTETIRRAMVPQMAAAAQAEADAGRPVWDTEAMRAEFTVTGFMAPFVAVTRKADGVPGTLMFTSNPRHYFGFAAN